jgi:ComF family protein
MMEMKNSLPICDKCGKYLQEDKHFCLDCSRKLPAFNIARAVGPYDESYRIAIKVFKFLGRKHLGFKMGCMMAEVVKEEARFWPLDIVVPVPASPGSLKQRGFNQTEVLARQVSKELKIKMDATSLYRIKETPSQRELTREEREKNLLFAFEVRNNKHIKGKNILLLDDVYTTGSTSRECTRVLLGAGASRVSVITWATGKGY